VGIYRKSETDMKIRKKKFEPKLRTIENKLWALCRQLTFRAHGTDCYTCNQKNLKGKNLQCGHGYSKGALGASMKYDLRILKPQCFNCNINFGGMGVVFWKNLETELGKENADKLYQECRASKGLPIKARPFYLELIKKYEELLKNAKPEIPL